MAASVATFHDLDISSSSSGAPPSGSGGASSAVGAGAFSGTTNSAFEPAVMAMDGGNYDARDRDRQMMTDEQGLTAATSSGAYVPPVHGYSPAAAEGTKAGLTDQEIMAAWGISENEQREL